MTLVLAAHGTRQQSGVDEVHRLAAAVHSELGGPDVRVCFVDVLGPTPSEVLRGLDGPAVLVPVFLASGYHVRTDVPDEVRASGHEQVSVTAAVGPDALLAQVMRERLVEVGWREGDAVVLAAAGSSDQQALAEVRAAAAMLAELVASPVRVGYVATAEPTVTQVVAEVRAAGAERVTVAPYLVAPGLFHTALRSAGADVVAEPLGVHPLLVALVAGRYRAALSGATRGSGPPGTADPGRTCPAAGAAGPPAADSGHLCDVRRWLTSVSWSLPTCSGTSPCSGGRWSGSSR